MISVTCDYCHKRIDDVAYRITGVNVDNLVAVGGNTYLHWACIAAWRGTDGI